MAGADIGEGIILLFDAKTAPLAVVEKRTGNISNFKLLVEKTRSLVAPTDFTHLAYLAAIGGNSRQALKYLKKADLNGQLDNNALIDQIFINIKLDSLFTSLGMAALLEKRARHIG